MVTKFLLLILSLISTQDVVLCGIAPTWDQCGCNWVTWKAWSDCSKSCGGGRRNRSRAVSIRTDKCAPDFSVCATNDMAWEYSDCNTICFNGGTFSGVCVCLIGWYGSCCSNEITCGNPGTLLNGMVSGSRYTYGKTVSYSCNSHYNLTDGSSTRTCQENSVWDGTQPRCAFVNSCASNPCLNGGTCVNGLDRYDCLCESSYSGVHCENDIQPPVVENCPSNMDIFSKKPTVFVNWTAPSFHDPVGTDIQVTTNYPMGSATFPCGDFVAQYVALKPSNGLRTECSFNITIRLDCPLGSFSDSRTCKLCSFGTYQDESGQSSCKLCPSNFTTKYLGSQNVTDCSNKSYSVSAQSSDSDLPVKGEKDSSNVLVISTAVIVSIVVAAVVWMLVYRQAKRKNLRHSHKTGEISTVNGSWASLNMIIPGLMTDEILNIPPAKSWVGPANIRFKCPYTSEL